MKRIAPFVLGMSVTSNALAAVGSSPMAGTFTTVEGWLTGDVMEISGVAAIVCLAFLIVMGHEHGHLFMYIARTVTGIAFGVFAIAAYTAMSGGAGASIYGPMVGLLF